MELFNLGPLPWDETQLIYHALAKLGRHGLCLCYPESPYVSVGFSQDPRTELDLRACKELGLPIFRREVGGGTVYLDGRQIFFQIILPHDHSLVSRNREVFYKRMLIPAVKAYQQVGVAAAFRAPNDLVAEGRKVSGTGGGEIGDSAVFVGNLILDFDHSTMARIINAPSERFRTRAEELMKANVSAINLEQHGPGIADPSELAPLLAKEYEGILGELNQAWIGPDIRAEMARLKEKMLAPEYLFSRGRRYTHPRVKIKAGLYLHQAEVELMAGRWSLLFAEANGRIRNPEIFSPNHPDLPPPPDLAPVVESLAGLSVENGLALFSAG